MPFVNAAAAAVAAEKEEEAVVLARTQALGPPS